MSDLLSVAVSKILALGTTTALTQAKRHETVLRILNKMGLSSQSVPPDFSSVYVYGLIEYGIDKPKEVLEFLRNDEVRQAAHHVFSTADQEEGKKQIAKLVHDLKVGDDILAIGSDPAKVFIEFLSVLLQVSQRSRTPAETQQDLVANRIETKLDHLMQAQASIPPESALQRQLRDWFRCLNYEFEEHEEISDRYFEYIIHVPARRGYDRVLVRGIRSEIQINDVTLAQDAAALHNLKEVWLISDRRISPSAREKSKTMDNLGVWCYTFDDLIDEAVDFSKYFQWLEKEVSRRGIENFYVPLGCIKKEYDHKTKSLLGSSYYRENEGWIDGYIDRWLDDPAKEHISILGEFGTGKTWFVFHYAWRLYQCYQDAKQRGVARPRIPLVIPLRDYAKAVNVESLFSDFFFRKHEIPLTGYSVFSQLNRMGKLLLMFDGFDEMSARVDRQKMINNFWELAKVVESGSKAILTCRTEHFPEAREGRALLNAELRASTRLLTGNPPQFEQIEPEMFNDTQLRTILTRRTTQEAVKLILDDEQLHDLARRPVMLDLILEALPDIEAGKPIALSRIYLYAIRRKLERDIQEQRTFTSMAEKVYFLCELSWEMLSSDQLSINYRQIPDRIRRLFGHVVQQEKDLDHWQHDMRSQTLLVPNEDGDYSPAHRSLLEFFVAFKIAAHLGILSEDFIDLLRESSDATEKQPTRVTSWSDYFIQKNQTDNSPRQSPVLAHFITDKMEQLVETVGQLNLTEAILEFMKDMLTVTYSETLLSQLGTLHGKSMEDIKHLAVNIANMVIYFDPLALKGKNLSDLPLDTFNTRLSNKQKNADLTSTSFNSTSLRKASLGTSVLCHASFRGAHLEGAQITAGYAYHAAVSPDHKRLALGSVSQLLLYNISDDNTYLTYKACVSGVINTHHVIFSPNGRYLINSVYDKHGIGFSLRDPQTMNLISTHYNQKMETNSRNKEPRNIEALSISNDSRYLYLACHDSIIYVWDIESMTEIAHGIGHSNTIVEASFSHSGHFLVSSSYDELILWDIAQVTPKLIRHEKWEGIVLNGATIHPTGKFIVAPTVDEKLKIIDTLTFEPLFEFPFKTRIVKMKFNSDGSVLCMILQSHILICKFSADLSSITEHMLIACSAIDRLGNPRYVRCYDLCFLLDKFVFVPLEGIFSIMHIGTSCLLTIDLTTGIVHDITFYMPHVIGADFRGASGIHEELLLQLRKHNCQM